MSLLRNLSHGLRSLFGKEQVSQELDEELNDFLEMAAPRLKTKSPRPPNRDRGKYRIHFRRYAPLYIPGAKTRIPAAPVTCERICGST